MKRKIDIKFLMVMLIGIVCLGIMFLYRLDEQKMPIVLLDEFGYWSSGAMFAGEDWSGIAQYNSYYSYGYGIILSFLIRIFGNTTYLYQTAILVNYIFLLIIFWLNFKIIDGLYQGNRYMAAMIALVVTAYPSNFSNLHIAWDELCLFFVFTVSFYFLHKFLKTNKCMWFVGWQIATFYLYMVHQRALGVLISGVLIVILLAYMKKINIRIGIYYIISTIGLVLIHKSIKSEILANVIVGATNTMAGVNDYPTIFQHIIDWFNLEGLKKLCNSIVGKFSYLMISTVGTVGIALIEILNCLKQDVIQKKERVTSDYKSILYLYLLLSLMSTILIASIFTLDGKRVDTLTYGRYIEWCIGPLVMIGLYKITMADIRIKTFVFSICVGIICILQTTGVYLKNPEWTEYAFVCAPVLFYIYKQIQDLRYLLIGVMIIIIISIVIIILHNEKSKREINRIAILFIIAGIYFIQGKLLIDRTMDSNYRSELVLEMNKKIEEIDDSADVYYIKDNGQTIWYLADLQVFRPYKDINSIKEEDIDNKKESFFLILDTYSPLGKELGKNKDVLASNWQVSLYYFNND